MEDAALVRVREAGNNDIPALAALTGQLGYPATADQMAERLSRIATDRNRTTFVAERMGRVVGYAGVWSGQNYEADAPQSRVMAFVVDSAERRQGIGTALMDAIEAWSRARGVAVIVLNSGDGRDDAHAFYERLGYRSTARRYLKRL